MGFRSRDYICPASTEKPKHVTQLFADLIVAQPCKSQLVGLSNYLGGYIVCYVRDEVLTTIQNKRGDFFV